MSFLWLITFDESEDFLSINLLTASIDNSVANLADQHNKPRWRVIVLGVGPDHENGVHDWNKEVSDIFQLVGWVCELIK